MKSSFKHPDKSPGYLLWKLSIKWHKRQRKALALLNLTHVQFVYLACLKWLEHTSSDSVTQIKLSALSGLDKMVVSETSQKLIRKKLITRNKDKHDGRSYVINLTKEGHELVDCALPIVEKIDKLFFIEEQNVFQTLSNISSSLV